MYPITDVTNADVIFGVKALTLMPTYYDIPDEFKDTWNPWAKVQAIWFFRGLPKGTQFIPREGVDVNRALNHIRSIQGSWEPKDEHKQAGVAFLLHEWFEDIIDPDGNSMVKGKV